MPVDLERKRTDLPYLRRRVRPEIAAELRAQQQSAAVAAPRPSLSLTTPGQQAAKSRYEVPTLHENFNLAPSSPVVRLSKRSSAIGSLFISGANIICWQTADSQGTQAVSDQADARIPVNAGRPLVEGYKGAAVIGLRHFRQLRRLLIEGAESLTVETATGGKINVVQVDGQPVRLSMLRLDGVLELRREHEDAGADFGFTR